MPQKDEAAIRDTLGRYMEGMKTADVALLRSAFHEHASFFGDFGNEVIAAPIEGLFEWAAADLEPGKTGANHRMEIDDVEIAGNVALVRCCELDFFGGSAREFFTLVRGDDGWKITNKSWGDI
jgi:hypothetical protein